MENNNSHEMKNYSYSYGSASGVCSIEKIEKMFGESISSAVLTYGRVITMFKGIKLDVMEVY